VSGITIPEIRINFSRLFYQDVSVRLNSLNSWELLSSDDYEKLAEQYRDEWAKKENIILSAMQKIVALKFYCPVIDITAAPEVIPKSEPLFINFRHRPETAIDTITHELCHTLLCDNTTVSIYGRDRDFRLVEELQRLFGTSDDISMLVHIPVYAMCKKIFEDYLDDKDYTTRDKALMRRFGSTSYLKAWDYVEKVGHEEIIAKLKKSYAEIANNKEKS
jgi:hypothetical protein